jgi:CTP:molybdopterin cytidylyltransferase MocA
MRVAAVPAVEAVILAAGSSTRLGRPKALLPLDGAPLLLRLCAVLARAGIRGGVVVAGEHAEDLRAAADPSPLRIVGSAHPEAGRTGSVQRGLAATDPASDVLLWPVDRPFASESTVRALAAARAGPGAGIGWIVPVQGGHAGHPLVLRAGVRGAVAAARPDASLRDVLRESGLARREVTVDDAWIHANVDTEEAWAEALAAWASRRAR